MLGKEIGRGGEGVVYELRDKPHLVAKIYSKEPDQDKREKILSMVRLKNERLLKLSAWPIEPYYSSSKLVGFVMEKLAGYRPIFELYNPNIRLQEFPRADWRFLIHTAINTARAFAVIHDSGHVVGDVNHANLFVAQDATVKFIDTDSFQIHDAGKHWFCEVGVSTHQAPEMQGSYKGILRTPDHDNFGLAVLIFQLLFLARHPFSGLYSGPGDMPIEKAISEYRFAFSSENNLMAPPPASLLLSDVTPKVRQHFERAFSKQVRPIPAEWISALQELAGNLKQCPTNPAHHHAALSCPWCRIEMKSGCLLFPFSESLARHTVEALWLQVMAIKDPGPDPSLPRDISCAPSQKAQQTAKRLDRLFKAVLGIAVSGLILAFLMQLFWLLVLALSLAGALEFYYMKVKVTLLGALLKEHRSAKAAWERFSLNHRDFKSRFPFSQVRQKLDNLKRQYDALPDEHEKRVQQIQNSHLSMKMKLKGRQIVFSGIEEIKPAVLRKLKKKGIETAEDVTEGGLKSVLDEPLARQLLLWRRRCEKEIFYEASAAAKEACDRELRSVEQDLARQRQKIEKEFTAEAQGLALMNQQIRERRRLFQTQAVDLLTAYAQTIADMQEVGLEPEE